MDRHARQLLMPVDVAGIAVCLTYGKSVIATSVNQDAQTHILASNDVLIDLV